MSGKAFPTRHENFELQPPRPPGQALFEFREYAPRRVASLLSLVQHSKFYRRESDRATRDRRFYVNGNASWDSCDGNIFVPGRICNATDAINAVQAFVFPEVIMSVARRGAAKLTDLFQKVARPQVLRDVTSGRLDPRKFGEIGQALGRGAIPADPLWYKRREAHVSAPPVIGIVGGYGNGQMWEDALYILAVTAIVLAIGYAAQSASMLTYGLLASECCELNKRKYKSLHYVYELFTGAGSVPLGALAILFHRDLYRSSFMAAATADLDGHDRLSDYTDDPGDNTGCGRCAPSWDGGAAVGMIRGLYAPDIVIGIGAGMSDAQTADVHIPYKRGGLDDLPRLIEAAIKAVEVTVRERYHV